MITLLLTLALQVTAPGFEPEGLWLSWPEERFVATPAPCLRPAELADELQRLAEKHPGRIQLEEVGRSFGDRAIYLLTLGRGPKKVLLWSQMHGDEPSATPALLDIADYLLGRADEPAAADILEELTLLMIPMLNPDGAELYRRQNLQGIDINRDALNLATPEGRLLKKIRDEYEPMLGFNLHDQNRRTAVGDTGVLATNAVLAVAGDEGGTVTPGRLRAKRACTAITEALAEFVPNGMARYDEDWSPRAFGDNLTAWGTPVVLIESGGLPPGRDFTELTRTNFVALLTTLSGLVRDDLASYDPQRYEDLPRNQRDAWADVVVRGGFLRQSGFEIAYRADLAVEIEVDDREAAGCGGEFDRWSRFSEFGDARFFGAGRVVDATGSLVVAPFVAGIEGWSARRWIDAEALEQWAGAGIGTVFWAVPDRKVEPARLRARALVGKGRARLEVTSASTPGPWLTLTGRPSAAASDSLADLVTSVAGASTWSEIAEGAALGRLWENPLSSPSELALSRGRPASFVLLSPAPEGKIDPGTARVLAVWIDGHEVSGDME